MNEKENWLIIKNNKYFQSRECGYYQNREDKCYHKDNKTGECTRKKCPYAVKKY